MEDNPQSHVCPDCGGSCLVTFGQNYAGSTLVWSQSISCQNCGFAIESDDSGFPPEPIRQYLISLNGRWGLHVTTDGPERLSACKILHCDLNTTLDEVKKMKDRIPGIVYTGTQAETDWMCNRLREFGFSSSIEKVDDDAMTQSNDLSHRLQYPTPRSGKR
jgi:hypothetical protein